MNDNETPPVGAPAPPLTVEEKIAALQKKEDDRQQKREDERKAKTLERLELIDKFETDLGPRGREFVVVDVTNLGEGFVVLRKPTAASHKRYMNAVEKAKDKGKPIEEADTNQYVLPCVVHPEKATYSRIANERHDVPVQCAAAMMSMLQAAKEADEGK